MCYPFSALEFSSITRLETQNPHKTRPSTPRWGGFLDRSHFLSRCKRPNSRDWALGVSVVLALQFLFPITKWGTQPYSDAMVSNAARILSGLFVSLLFFFGLVPSANASDPVVCQTADLSGMSDAARTSEIASKINDVSCDVVELVGSATIAVTSTLTIDGVTLGAPRDVTIREAEGTEVVFVGTTATTVIELVGTMDVLRVEGLTFQGATESAIYSGIDPGNEIHLTDTLFTMNTTSGAGGAIYTIGSVYLSGTNTFSQNVAPAGNGGAIFAVQGVFGAGVGNLLVLNGNIVPGVGTSGGGIYSPGPVQLQDLQAHDNLAASSAGAVFASSLSIAGDAEFLRNRATSDGGAVYSIQTTTVASVTASGNESTTGSGGTFFSVGDFTATGHQNVNNSRASGGSGGYVNGINNVQIASISATDTYADSNGGVIFAIGSLTVSNSLVSSNSESGISGGVAASTNSISIAELQVTNAEAGNEGGAVSSWGGSINISGDAVINTAISGGTAGALYAQQDIVIGGSYTSTNTAATSNGGSLMALFGSVTITGETSITISQSDNDGGAIFAGTNVSLASGSIVNATATGNGGCIHVINGSVSATGAFIFNTCRAPGGNGGAISAQGNVSLAEALFVNPYSFFDGGAIITITGDVSFSGPATFQNAQSLLGAGGAIAAGGNITAQDLTITTSRAGDHGGAIFSPTGSLTVNGTLTAEDLTAGGSGGVANVGGNISLNNVSIARALVDNHGGAFFSPAGNFTASGNVSITGSSAVDAGGALNIGGNITFSGANTELSDNSSQDHGGAIFSPVGNLLASGTVTFNNNQADGDGGALNVGGNIQFENANFSGNSTPGIGGAIFNPSGAISATGNVLFHNNSAGSTGGAISMSGNLSLHTGTFSDNSADADGGAVFTPMGTVSSTGLVVFSGNSAGASGGAIAGSMNLQQALFSQNTAVTDGGAAFAVSVEVGPGSRFTANSADTGGALVVIGNASFAGVGFDLNSATADGGAIFAPGSTTTLVNSSFYRNSAAAGGAVYGSDVISFGSYFAENAATDAAGVGAGGVLAFGTFESALSTFQDNTSAADGPEIKAGDFFAVGNIIDSASPTPIVAGIYEDEGANFFTGITDLSFDSALFGRDAELGLQAATLDTSFGQGLYVPGISSTSIARDSVTTQMLQSTSNNGFYSQDFRDLFAGLLSDPQVTLDMLGNARAGEAIDAGAIEYQLLPQLAITRAELLADGMTLELETNLPLASSIEPETFEVFADDASVEFLVADIASGDTVITITLAAPQEQSVVVTVDYAGNNVVSETEPFNTIGSLSQQAVVNNSQYVTPVAAGGYFGPIVYLPSSLGTLYPGQEVTLFGQNLSLVEKINIGGQDAKVTVLNDTSLVITVPEVVAGEYNLEVVSSFGFLTVQPSIFVADGSLGVQGLQVIIKRISDTQAKIWAKNPIDAGKIQFKLNDREIAWIRAIDTEDPKLRKVNELYYLVRTIDLKPGKNALEVFVEGERVRRVSYSG